MNYRWPDLLNKYLEGKITDTEREEFNRQAALSKAKQEQLEHFATRKGIISQLQDLDKIDPARQWECFKKQMDAVRQRKMYRVRNMAAAALVTFLTTLFYMFSPRELSITFRRPPFSIQNLAIGKGPELILGNGSVIKLDSVPEGAIIAPGIPFMKKKSTLVYVQMDHKDQVQAQGIYILSVPPCRQYQVTLADSSVMMVNASSQLYFPVNFSTNERWVAIKGQAYFEVNANPAKPFFVNVNDQLYTEVTGTSFNIEAYNESDSIRTTLVEGHLAVIEYSSKKSKSLLAGQQASFKNGSFIIYDSLNLNEVTAWKENEFNFNKKSIYEIMQEIGRWYNVKIKYNGRMPAKTFTASLSRLKPLSEIVNAISLNIQVSIKINGDTLIVSSEH